jgi:hypothetical protein
MSWCNNIRPFKTVCKSVNKKITQYVERLKVVDVEELLHGGGVHAKHCDDQVRKRCECEVLGLEKCVSRPRP